VAAKEHEMAQAAHVHDRWAIPPIYIYIYIYIYICTHTLREVFLGRLYMCMTVESTTHIFEAHIIYMSFKTQENSSNGKKSSKRSKSA